MIDCPNPMLPNMHTFRIRWRWQVVENIMREPAAYEWRDWYELNLPDDVSKDYKQWKEREWTIDNEQEREYEIEKLCK